MKSLDMGCGKNKRPGSIGLDMNRALPGVDVEYEVRRGRGLPFATNSFDEIYIIDLVEHVDDIAWLLSEVHRVAVPEARVEIQYPHYSSRNAYGDVTHRHLLGLHAFDHFIPATKLGERYQYFTLFNRVFPFGLEKREVIFKIDVVSRPLYAAFGEDVYESMFCRSLPISTIDLKLKVLKE